MLKAARERLIRKLRADTTLFTSVKGRIYPQELATLPNPSYPCVTFKMDGGEADEHIPALATCRVSFRVHSTVSYNQCWDIYEQIKDVLAFEVVSDSNVRMRFREINTPVEDYDPIARTYTVISRWQLQVFEV